MRRADREICDAARLEAILQKSQTVCIAFGGGAPYVIPMSYGYALEEGRLTLYMHGAGEGEKIRRIQADPRAAFTLYADNAVYGGEAACRYSTSFDSVCGSGMIRVLAGAEKWRGLQAIMAHYAPGKAFAFDERRVQATCVLALEAESFTGKHHD